VKIAKVLVAALSAGTLFAQSAPEELDSRIQLFVEGIRPAEVTLNAPNKDQPKACAGFGARFMGEIASARNFYYEIGGRLDASSNMTSKQVGADLTDIRITDSYWSAGMGYLVPLGPFISLGFHLEGRGEAIRATGSIFNGATATGSVNASTTYLRAWGRVSVDGSWRMGSLRPFVGLDVSATPMKNTQTTQLTNVSTMDNRTLRSFAPTLSAGAYLGLHF
jgi:hypothetical protein